MKIDKCMNCDSDKIIPSVRIYDQGEHSSGDLELVVQGDPDAMFFKESHWGAILGEKRQKHVIEPTMCQQCGTCWYTCPKCAVEDAHGFCREKKDRPRIPKAAIDPDICVGCQNCLFNCENGAISHKKGMFSGHCSVDTSRCQGCGSCLTYCANACINLS